MNSIADALLLAHDRLRFSGSPRLDAELLLAHVLGLGRSALHARPERLLNDNENKEFQRLLARRKRGEPVAYLLGSAGFMDFELEVNPAVLIPRPETELLVELALETLTGRNGEARQVADLGAGCGAIAIALARARPAWQVTAVDVSERALEVARRNATALGAGKVNLVQANWCESLGDAAFDLIVANPPYVAPEDPALHPDCAFEPEIALFSGKDGLTAIREIIAQSRRCLKPGGFLLLEHGCDQRARVNDLLLANGYCDIHNQKDHAAHDRIVRARRENN